MCSVWICGHVAFNARTYQRGTHVSSSLSFRHLHHILIIDIDRNLFVFVTRIPISDAPQSDLGDFITLVLVRSATYTMGSDGQYRLKRSVNFIYDRQTWTGLCVFYEQAAVLLFDSTFIDFWAATGMQRVEMWLYWDTSYASRTGDKKCRKLKNSGLFDWWWQSWETIASKSEWLIADGFGCHDSCSH